ncbi:hypothetical protein LDENG_00050820 [Lucifuga dentata]|nr:hypothetical protein LDENG_00050820 [Lucifuga dentata]
MDDFYKYWKNHTLDPNTAYYELKRSEDDAEATYVQNAEPIPDHAERFDYWEQLLCREGLTGCCSWEVEWSSQDCGKVGSVLWTCSVSSAVLR